MSKKFNFVATMPAMFVFVLLSNWTTNHLLLLAVDLFLIQAPISTLVAIFH